jgi:hypothetical protein
LSDAEEVPPSWQAALAEDPAYYMDTEQGQRELAEMIRNESQRLLEELGRTPKRTREIIWLSRFCRSCKFYEQTDRRTTCRRWNVRIVKPFYGRPIWTLIKSSMAPNGKEEVIHDIDWDKKWKNISDRIVEWTVAHVNDGAPYFCYDSGGLKRT